VIASLLPWRGLLAAVLLLQLANGLQSTAVGLESDRAQFSDATIAMVMTAFYAGQFAGGLLISRLVARYGHAACIAALCIAGGGTLALFALGTEAWLWTLARFLCGVAFAGLYTSLESWINDRTPNETRGTVFSVYLLAQLIALAASQYLLPGLALAFPQMMLIAAALMASAALPALSRAAERPQRRPATKMDPGYLLSHSPLGALTVAGAGFVWSIAFAMGPIFAQRAGLSLGEISTFVAAGVIGGVLVQVPAGWLSDRIPRRLVIMGLCTAACAAALAGLFAGGIWLTAASFAFGFFSFPLYTLGVAHVNDRIEPEHRVAVSAALILMFAAGSIAGPLLTSWAMSVLGGPGYFLTLALGSGALAVFAVVRQVMSGGQASPQAASREAR
jgi:MFS family permease